MQNKRCWGIQMLVWGGVWELSSRSLFSSHVCWLNVLFVLEFWVITNGGAQGTIEISNLADQIWLQGKHPTHCTIILAPGQSCQLFYLFVFYGFCFGTNHHFESCPYLVSFLHICSLLFRWCSCMFNNMLVYLYSGRK